MAEPVRLLKIDFEKCIKAGECYYNHPDLFLMTDSGFPALKLRRPVTESEIREAQEAIEVCPSQALSLVEGTDA
jgi:ferredoxin